MAAASLFRVFREGLALPDSSLLMSLWARPERSESWLCVSPLGSRGVFVRKVRLTGILRQDMKQKNKSNREKHFTFFKEESILL